MKHVWLVFLRNDNGAVTVDWVVLAAAVVALGVAVGGSITTGTTDLSDAIWAYMDGIDLFKEAQE